MGYFHGYKGYRYCYSPSSLLPYTGFNELQAVYEFDMNLKAILYPQIMFLETTIKTMLWKTFSNNPEVSVSLIFIQNFLMTIKLFLSVAENIKNRLQSE